MTCANKDKCHPSAESPTSENAAAERHAHAEREDPPCTKDLTRGTKDIDNRIVGRCHAPNRFGTVNMEDNINIE